MARGSWLGGLVQGLGAQPQRSRGHAEGGSGLGPGDGAGPWGRARGQERGIFLQCGCTVSENKSDRVVAVFVYDKETYGGQ